MSARTFRIGVALTVFSATALLFAQPFHVDTTTVHKELAMISTSATSAVPLFESDAAAARIAKFPKVKTPYFQVGERLDFLIKYEFMVGGHATLEVEEGPPLQGRPTFHFISKAESNSFIDTFFKVRDFNASMVDRETMASLNFHQNLREGHYRVVRNTQFDYGAGKYQYQRQYKGKENLYMGDLNEPVSDILSSFFVARILPLELGKEYSVQVFDDKRVYPLRVLVDKKLHTVSVPAGRFKCIRIQPIVEGDAIFKIGDGSMYIWLTNDERRIPVLIRSRVTVGAFDAELAEINRPFDTPK